MEHNPIGETAVGILGLIWALLSLLALVLFLVPRTPKHTFWVLLAVLLLSLPLLILTQGQWARR